MAGAVDDSTINIVVVIIIIIIITASAHSPVVTDKTGINARLSLCVSSDIILNLCLKMERRDYCDN